MIAKRIVAFDVRGETATRLQIVRLGGDDARRGVLQSVKITAIVVGEQDALFLAPIYPACLRQREFRAMNYQEREDRHNDEALSKSDLALLSYAESMTDELSSMLQRRGYTFISYLLAMVVREIRSYGIR